MKEILPKKLTYDRLPFYAGETAWHRDWKNAFPEAFRERTFFDPILGQQHRADVHTRCGTTIEFQNSPLSIHELRSREAFYSKLVWVVNGKKFKGFKVLKALPDLNDPRIAAYEFTQTANLSMIRKSDVLAQITKPRKFTFHHPELRSINFSSQNYSFCWRHPHRVWYQAKCPLIFDLGGYFLYQLKHRAQISGDYAYLQMIPRKTFIADYCG